VRGADDGLVQAQPLPRLVPNWAALLARDDAAEQAQVLLREPGRHEATGRPLAGETFVSRIESIPQRGLRPQRPDPKRQVVVN
jgi:putative transposase